MLRKLGSCIMGERGRKKTDSHHPIYEKQRDEGKGGE
jgi:hypothetical protein